MLPLSNNEMCNSTTDETLLDQDINFTMPNFEDMFDNIDMLDWVREPPPPLYLLKRLASFNILY
jgi:hypothetical protein